MSDILKLIQRRRSTRVPFDPHRPVAKEDLRQIIEAGRWAPTAHNMQNFEILVIDGKELLEKIGNIRSRIRKEFIRENYQQLSFSEKELLQKKVGVLGTVFPPEWRDPSKFDKIIGQIRSLQQTMRDCLVILIVIYDSRKRAPASKGDVLGIMSLGCVMESMWLMAESLGISFQIMSTFSGYSVEKEVKRILDIPKYMKIAFAVRMGYPISAPTKLLRVRRDVKAFTHHNRYGNKGID